MIHAAIHTVLGAVDAVIGSIAGGVLAVENSMREPNRYLPILTNLPSFSNNHVSSTIRFVGFKARIAGM